MNVSEWLLSLELQVVQTWQWPLWSVRLIAVLSLLVIIIAALEQFVSVSTASSSESKKNEAKPTWEFRWFQLQYLSVFLLTMLADWLQGTNMYTLYMVSNVKL